MEIVFICFRLISGSKELVYCISTAGWEVPLSRTSLLDPFPVLTVPKSPLWSASLESEKTGSSKLPIFLIIMDDAPRALFLDLCSRGKRRLLAYIQYKDNTCLTLLFELILHVKARARSKLAIVIKWDVENQFTCSAQSVQWEPKEITWLIGWLLKWHIRVWLLYVTGWMCVFTFTVKWACVLAC